MVEGAEPDLAPMKVVSLGFAEPRSDRSMIRSSTEPEVRLRARRDRRDVPNPNRQKIISEAPVKAFTDEAARCVGPTLCCVGAIEAGTEVSLAALVTKAELSIR